MGRSIGANLRSAGYSANNLNQYTQRDVPGYLDIMGSATNTATVTVNLQSSYRKGEYFRKELTTDNASGPVWQAITNIAVRPNGASADLVTTNKGNLLLAKAAETFLYDSDGNLISDSLWTNRWDGENRRTNVESTASVPTSAKVREGWTYLPDGRWSQRIVSTNNGSGWVITSTNHYVWDGQALLAVLDHTNGVVTAFLRGLDLSGSPQGAGGVGGVLVLSQRSSGAPTTAFYTYDGNGNVSALLNATNGTEAARYEYDPFGRTIRGDGTLADINPIRFSTQYADDNTADLKYLYRDYRADVGRWISKDPIDERGGLNLHAHCQNNAINYLDKLGLWKIHRKGQSRAIAYPDEGDTIRRLAIKIGLNENEWKRWLKPEKVYSKAYDLDSRRGRATPHNQFSTSPSRRAADRNEGHRAGRAAGFQSSGRVLA